jgi:hypothetical protein
MNKRVYLLTALLLAACTPEPVKKTSTIPPLASVAGKILPGMGVAEVNKTLAGHLPFLQYTDRDHAIWEITERESHPEKQTLNANKLTIVFDPQGRVQDSSSSFCFLPDVEAPVGSAPATHCYQKQIFPFAKPLTYDAIKRLLIISNYQVDHSDAASEIISATGLHPAPDNKNKMMFIKVTIIFSPKANFTEVVMSATFSLSEKQSTWVQAGFAGVTLPVPLPFQKTEEWIDSGIVTPKFYLEFYDALAKLIAREYLPYTPITATAATPPPPAFTAPKPPAASQTERVQIDSFPSRPSSPIDADLSRLGNQPIDSSNLQTAPSETADPNVPEATDGDPLAGLGNKPIDSSPDKPKHHSKKTRKSSGF